VAALLDLLRAPHAEAPAFRFGQVDTRFLGDLYQDLSADVRETYALLQTPDFVEAFILDRTLEPAIVEYGVDAATILDPTCGSGHFLLGAFERLFDRLCHEQPGLPAAELANRAMALVHGVDLNPYAVAIARFRLTLAYWQAIGLRSVTHSQGAPPRLNVVAGDSLLYAGGEQGSFGDRPDQQIGVWTGLTFALDEEGEAKALLSKRFAAVVGNPPYITVKDAVMREEYRRLYPNSASGKYALSAPYLERFFQLARPGGFTGQITSNSFMKREFGKKLVETVLPRLDLTLVVNTAGAYIPGHGTPTVILCGRNRRPEGEASETVLAVLSKRGEPSTPADPAKGEVWTSILEHGHEVGYDGEYISVEAVRREVLLQHPWSLEGGGAGALKEILEARAEKRLGEIAESIGISSFTLEDDVYLRPRECWRRLRVQDERLRAMVIGEAIRDWSVEDQLHAFFPYDESLEPIRPDETSLKVLWPHRTGLANNMLFGGKTKVEGGLHWYEFGRLTANKLKTPLSITFAFVATHNHFVLDRGGKVFKQSAPIIKLPEGASEDDHLALLAYLNSSTACFWMKQVAQQRTITTGDKILQPDLSKLAYEFTSTHLQSLPIPALFFEAGPRARLIAAAREVDALARRRGARRASLLDSALRSTAPLIHSVEVVVREDGSDLARQAALQEVIDILSYCHYGLVPNHLRDDVEATLSLVLRDSCARLPPHERAYLAEQARGILPDLCHRLAAASKPIAMIESPMYKRRWIGTQGRFQAEGASLVDDVRAQAREWLAARVEEAMGTNVAVWSLTAICMVIEAVPRYGEVCELVDPEAPSLRAILATVLESVPFLAAYRYTDAGAEKRALWEQTWELQRLEDAGRGGAPILVPPKYDVKDFRDANFYRLRGKLDVPKERFISYPGCESDEDGEPIYGWAGWDHLQRAAALVDLFYKRKDGEGWPAERLVPILSGLLELLPWLKQWHNEPDADGERMGEQYELVLDEELRQLGLRRERLRAWRPEPGRRGRGKAAAAVEAAEAAEAAEAEQAEQAPAAAASAERPAKRRGRPPKDKAKREAAADAPPLRLFGDDEG
jgi:hypothetical protein